MTTDDTRPLSAASEALPRRPHRAWPKGDEEWRETLAIIEASATEVEHERHQQATDAYKQAIRELGNSPEARMNIAIQLMTNEIEQLRARHAALVAAARDGLDHYNGEHIDGDKTCAYSEHMLALRAALDGEGKP